MPPPPRLAERVRLAARPLGRVLPLRAVDRRGPAPAALRARHQRARDHVAHADRLAHRHRPPGRRTVRRRPSVPSGTGACPATRRRRERSCASRRATAVGSRCRLNCLPLFDYGRNAGRVELRRRRLRPAHRAVRRPLARAGEQPAARHRRCRAATDARRSTRASRRSWRCRGAGRPRPRSTRRSRSYTRPRGSGATG